MILLHVLYQLTGWGLNKLAWILKTIILKYFFLDAWILKTIIFKYFFMDTFVKSLKIILKSKQAITWTKWWPMHLPPYVVSRP